MSVSNHRNTIAVITKVNTKENMNTKYNEYKEHDSPNAIARHDTNRNTDNTEML